MRFSILVVAVLIMLVEAKKPHPPPDSDQRFIKRDQEIMKTFKQLEERKKPKPNSPPPDSKRDEEIISAFRRTILEQKLEEAKHQWKRVENSAQRQRILDWHNSWRAKVAKGLLSGQPPAANMIALEWDDRLETSARKWATGCSDQMHNENSDRIFAPYPFVGQNYAGSQERKLKKESMFMGWANEHEDYSYDQNGCKDGGTSCVIGHYTQLVWARSALVGCHIADCSGADFNKFICEYAMGGNWGSYKEGQPKPKPYKRGPACSACPHGYEYCMDDALCATKRACDSGPGSCRCSLNAGSCGPNGQFDSSSCTCKCNQGWGGPRCQEPCKDVIDFCERYKTKCFPSDPEYWKYFMWFDEECRETCKRCQWIEDNDRAHQNANGITTTGSLTAGEEAEEKTEQVQEIGPNGCRDTDSTENCGFWKAQGGCDSNKIDMEQRCPLTCELGCGAPHGGDCKDDNRENCKGWAAMGSCNQDYLKSYCKKSCGLCSKKKRRTASSLERRLLRLVHRLAEDE